MTNGAEACVDVEVEGEQVPLRIVPGQGDQQRSGAAAAEPGKSLVTRIRERFLHYRKDQNYRVLAVSSIICGVSCIGIKALISSVKAGETNNPDAAMRYRKEAKKFSIISIVTLFGGILFCLTMLALVSYLATLQD